MVSTVKDKVLQWLAGPDTGASAKTIAFAAMRLRYECPSEPADASDLGRCLRLLRAVPELEPRWRAAVAAMHPLWPVYVDRWDQFAGTMRREIGLDWEKGRSAPETYRLLQLAHADAYERTGVYDVKRTPEGFLSSAIRRGEPGRGSSA